MLIQSDILASFTQSPFFFVSVCIHPHKIDFLDTLWKKCYCVRVCVCEGNYKCSINFCFVSDNCLDFIFLKYYMEHMQTLQKNLL